MFCEIVGADDGLITIKIKNMKFFFFFGGEVICNLRFFSFFLKKIYHWYVI